MKVRHIPTKAIVLSEHTGIAQRIILSRYERSIARTPDIFRKRILDIGCNLGYGAALASESAASVVGVDYNRSHVNAAKEEHALCKNLSFAQMDASCLAIKDGSFDAVFAFEVIEHMRTEDQKKFLGEVSRVIANDGYFFISTPNKGAYVAKGNMSPDHIDELTRMAFLEMLSEHFENIQEFWQCTMKQGFRSALAQYARAAVSANPKVWSAVRRVIPKYVRNKAVTSQYDGVDIHNPENCSGTPGIIYAICSNPKK